MGAGGTRCWSVAWLVCAILLLLGAPGNALARDAARQAALTPCVAPVLASDDVAALFDTPARFDCATPQTAFGAGDFRVLLKGERVAAIADQELSVRLGSVWMTGLTLHARYRDGHIASRAYSSRDLSDVLALGALITLSIERRAAPLDALMIETRGSANLRGIVLDPVLQTVAAKHAAETRSSALYAGFAGLALALFVYNLVLWLTLRHGFQLWYCAMILATMGYAFTSSGAPALLIEGLDNNDRLRANYVLLALTASTAIMFLRHFFEDRVVTRTVRRAIGLACAAMLGAGLAFALLAPLAIALLDRLYFLSFMLMLLVAVPLLASAWTKRSQFLTLFLVAWSAPIGVTALRSLHGLGVIPYSFWLDNGTILAMAFESLLSSLAIAYRIRLLSEERDRAREQESAALALADTDPLTGLLNRRSFLRAAIGRERRQRLLLIDIDHFKLVNDRLGHDGGDEVLRLFARVLRGNEGAGRLTARLGGEEFALLTDDDVALDCDALLAQVRATRMPFDLRITASIGIADGPVASEEDWSALYRAADAALYNAKFSGRDCARSTPRARAA